jgi:hypothetical protein
MSALRVLFGCWLLGAAAFIEFYARRYADSGTPLLPHGLLAILALGLLLLPPRVRAAVPLRPQARRLGTLALVCAVALAFALLRPLQLLHVSIVAGLLAAALGALAPVLRGAGPPWPARLAATAVLAALTFGLLVYYAVLVIGLEMWHEIVTRKLLWTYARQLPELVAALPVSPWLPWSAAAALYGVLLLVYWLALPGIARDIGRVRKPVRAYLALSGAGHRRRWAGLALVLLLAALLFDTKIDDVANGKQADPLAATFFGIPRARGTNNMPLRPNPALDAAAWQAAARYAAPAPVERRTLVLVTVDALRADQMHVYGHARDNTPFLSRLHREGRLTRFDNAFSVCTESHCGLLGILAGRYWHELSTGKRRFGLHDALKRLGYRTHFVLGGDHTNFYDLRAHYGDNVDEYIDGASASGYMNDDAEVIGWLRRLETGGDAPRFIYVHLMSTHILAKRHDRYNLWHGKPLVGSADLRYTNSYHHGIRQADALIEEVFSILGAKALLEDALVVITADHGELLGDAGGVRGHGGPPGDALVRVPLLIFDARGFAYPPRKLASVVDVAPTFLERIGAPVPTLWSGVPLSRPEQRRFVFMQTRDEAAIVGEFGGELYKYYYRTYRGAPSEELVKLVRPGEERVVPDGDRPEVRSALRAELDRQQPGLRRAR